MTDLYGLYQILSDLLGAHWAGLAILGLLILASVFLYYYHIRLRPIDGAGTDAQRAEREVSSYSAWRERLAAGGRIGDAYNRALSSALDRIDRFFDDGDHLEKRGRQPYWTGAALEKCLGLAVAYPILSLLISWYVTGYVGPIEAELRFSATTQDWARLVSALIFLAALALSGWVINPPEKYETWIWRGVRLGLGFSLAIALVPVSNFLSTGIGPALATGVVVIALLIPGVVAFGTALALALSNSGLQLSNAIAWTVAVVGAALWVSIQVTTEFLERLRIRWLMLLGFLISVGILIPVFMREMPHLFSVDTINSNWIYVVLFVALPLINAVFDWISLGVTRYLLRTGQRRGGLWPLALAIIDLVIATALLFALLIASLIYIHIINSSALASGAPMAFDVDNVLSMMRSDPSSPALWWIYITIFTTFLPSLVNLLLGGLCLVRGLPWLSKLMVVQFFPADLRDMITVQRFAGSAFLTLQFAVSAAGAVLLALIFVTLFAQGLQLIGINLLNIAENANMQITRAFVR